MSEMEILKLVAEGKLDSSHKEDFIKSLTPELSSKLFTLVMMKELDCIGKHFRHLLALPREILEFNLGCAEEELIDAENRIGVYAIVCLRNLFEEFKKVQDEAIRKGESVTHF